MRRAAITESSSHSSSQIKQKRYIRWSEGHREEKTDSSLFPRLESKHTHTHTQRHPARATLLSLGRYGATLAFTLNSPPGLNAFPNEHLQHCQHRSSCLMANIVMHYSVSLRKTTKKKKYTQAGPANPEDE